MPAGGRRRISPQYMGTHGLNIGDEFESTNNRDPYDN
jgi:hypothetical protein